MHARVTQVDGAPENLEAGITRFRDDVVPFVQAEPGGKGSLLLVDRSTGKGLAITLWESEKALRASEERANALRAQAADDMGATDAPVVERYEVVVYET